MMLRSRLQFCRAAVRTFSTSSRSYSKSSVLKYVSGGAVATSALVYTIYNNRVDMKAPLDMSTFLAEPITSVEDLNAKSTQIPTKMEMMIMRVQAAFVQELQELEAKHSNLKFQVDRWTRKEGGGGISCVLQDGQVFEKAGVNISVFHGVLTPATIAQMRSRGREMGEGPHNFTAMGISSVIHPRNPMVPTLHFNYRYFEVTNKKGEKFWWFGGGTDLTPYYLDKDDVRHFHESLKNACDRHNPKFYPKFKEWCDKYFYIPHRGISRGVGGIFFDDLEDSKPEKVFNFVEECANSVIPGYIPLIKKNMDKGYGYKERDWQLIRRGQYVEFNLVYDRGTKFGLATPGARYESILMSLPLNARWYYQKEMPPDSLEEELLEVLRKPRKWV